MRSRHGKKIVHDILRDHGLSTTYQAVTSKSPKPPHRTLAEMLWNSLNIAKRKSPTAVRRRLMRFREKFGRRVAVLMSGDLRFREFQGLRSKHNLSIPLVKLSPAQKDKIIATWQRTKDITVTARLHSTRKIPLKPDNVRQLLVQAGVHTPKTVPDPHEAYWAGLTESQIDDLVETRGLHPTERRVLLELAAGGNPYEIANRLEISRDALKQATMRLRRKLGLGRVRPTKK